MKSLCIFGTKYGNYHNLDSAESERKPAGSQDIVRHEGLKAKSKFLKYF
jgi:hypothetical protein